VQKFNDGSELEVVITLVANRPAGQQDQQGSQALAATFDNILGDLFDQRNV
jgi:hypothetical protein